MYPDISLDLETLDNSPRSLILSIGLCAFDRFDPERGLYKTEIPVAIVPQLLWRKINPDTVRWWLKQDDEAKDAIWKLQKGARSLRGAIANLSRLINTINTHGGVRVWGNGASFDNAILEDVYKNTLRKNVPWAFWDNRCLRTLADDYQILTGDKLKEAIPFVGVRHGAEADAVHQAKLIQHASMVLKKAGIKG